MTREMDSELLPRRFNFPTETARLVLRFNGSIDMALLDLLPYGPCWVRVRDPLDSGFGLGPGLREFMIPYQVLEEVVSAIASVPAVINVAGPPL